MWDKHDKEYLKRLVEKTIAESDGKIPLNQLYRQDYDKWDGVNIQGEAQCPPEPDQDTLALYMIDADRRLSKRFTVTNAILWLLGRKTERIFYGTSDPEGHQMKIVLQWEKETRVDPTAKKIAEGMHRRMEK